MMGIKAQSLTDLIASSVSSAYWKPDLEPIRRVYNLNGFTFGVAAGDEQLASFLDPILAPLACPPTASCDWIVELSPVAVVDVPTDARRIFEGPLPEGLTCAMVEDGDGRKLIVPGHFAMWFRRAARRTDLSFVPGKEDGLGGTAAFWMLDDLLAAHGRFLLHGGLVVDPKSESSIAIFAPSGTGKTTTVLALAHAGFCLAGDDALVLDVGEDGCGMWAVPRKLKVDRKTAALLPWLDALLTGNWIDNEQALEIGALQPVVSCALPRRRRVGLVVVLTSPNPNDHAITPIAKPDALMSIACDNLRIAPGGVDADNARALAALGSLVARTPVVALSVGPNPGSLTRKHIGWL